MGVEFFFFFGRGGTTDHEFTELQASRLAHLQLEPTRKDGERINTGREGGEGNSDNFCIVIINGTGFDVLDTRALLVIKTKYFDFA